MTRARGSTVRLTPLAGVAVAVAFGLLARPAFAQDQATRDLKVAQALLDHGVFEGAASIADNYTDKSDDARAIRASALYLKVHAEKDAKLKNEALAEAKKAQAEVKGKRAAEVDAYSKGPQPHKFNLSATEELDLAWNLKLHGHVPWAEGLLDAAIAGKVFSGKELVTARTIRAQLFGDRSFQIKGQDGAKRKEAAEKAKEILLDISKGGDKEQVIDAKCTYYDILYKRGAALLETSKHTDDLAAGEALKKEALDAFKDGVSYLELESKQLEEEMNKAMQPGTPPEKEPEPPKEGEPEKGSVKGLAERCLIFAKYYWPKCLVGQAKCLATREEHDALLKKAIELYSDYNLMFNDPQNPNPQAFEAAIDMADACREVGDDAQALVALESALGIEKMSADYEPLHPEATKNKPLSLDDGQLDVFARASLVKAKAQMGKGDYAGALKTFNKVFDDAKEGVPTYEKGGNRVKNTPRNPPFDESEMGKLLKIERAEALARTGKKNDALKDLDKLFKEDQTGPIGMAANAKANKIKGVAGAGDESEGGATTAMALDKATKALGETPPDVGAAANNARQALRLARNEGSTSKVNPKAYMLLGQAYRSMGRYYEAAVAFEEVQRYGDAPEADRADAALQRVGCFAKTKQLLEKGATFDRDQYTRSLDFLTQKFKGKGVASYLLGDERREEQKWEEAAQAYEKVEADAGTLYDKALLYNPLCRYNVASNMGRDKKDPKPALEATEAGLKRAIDAYKKDASVGDDARKAERKNLDAQARFLLADVLLKEAINKPTEVLALFEGAEQTYAGDAERIARAGIFRVLAYLKLGKSDKAEEQLQALLKDDKFRGLKRTLLAAKDVGGALDKEASKKELAGDEHKDERQKLRKRAGQYYARWILDGLDPKSEMKPTVLEMKYVANKLFIFALDVAGLPEDGGIFGEVAEGFEPGEAKQLFADSCAVFGALARLTPEQGADQIKKDKWMIFANWGETAGFMKDWPTCKEGLEGMVAEMKLLDSQGQVDFKVVSARKELLAYYHDLGRAYVEVGAMGKDDASGAFKKAFAVFDNVLNTAQEKTPVWWKAKLNYYHALERRGTEPDFKELGVAMVGLKRKYPDFKDAGAMAPAYEKLYDMLVEKKIIKPEPKK